MNDIRDAWRSLCATPIVSVVVVLSLGLGIGANTAIFSLVNAVALKPVPGRDPGSLYHLSVNYGGPYGTYRVWQQIRDRRMFAETFAWSQAPFNLSPAGPAELVEGMRASGEIFDVLGVSAVLGRTFTTADDQTGGGPDGRAAVIGFRFWQRRFGGAAGAIGQPIVLDRVTYTIVGVAPPSFAGMETGFPVSVIVPLAASPTSSVRMLVRLLPGQTAEAATLALRAAAREFRDATRPAGETSEERIYTDREVWTVEPASARRTFVKGRYERPLYALMVLVALVLLIACTNIATLLSARVVSRRPELAVRVALGASRWQIARLLLAESVALSALGIAGGIVMAQWSGPLASVSSQRRPSRSFSSFRPTGGLRRSPRRLAS